MTTTDKLIRLITAKRDMKEALKEKGVETWGGLNIYPEAVNRIGTGIARITLTDGMKLCFSEWETIEVDCSNVTSLSGLFLGCTSLKNVRIGDTSHIIIFGNTFENCYSLTKLPTIDISSAGTHTSDGTIYLGANMFYGCYRLVEVSFKGDPKDWTPGLTVDQLGANNNGVLYYDSRYDYSHIISELPSNWVAVPIEYV